MCQMVDALESLSSAFSVGMQIFSDIFPVQVSSVMELLGNMYLWKSLSLCCVDFFCGGEGLCVCVVGFLLLILFVCLFFSFH